MRARALALAVLLSGCATGDPRCNFADGAWWGQTSPPEMVFGAAVGVASWVCHAATARPAPPAPAVCEPGDPRPACELPPREGGTR
jgi:hypothetical protein